MEVINFQDRSTVEKGYDELLLQLYGLRRLDYDKLLLLFYELRRLCLLVNKTDCGSSIHRMLEREIRFVCLKIRYICQGREIDLRRSFHRAIFEGCDNALVVCILTIVQEATTVEKCDPAVRAMIPSALIHNRNKLWDKIPCWGMVILELVADLISGSRMKHSSREIVADLISGSRMKHSPREIVADLIGRVMHVPTEAWVLNEMDKPWPLPISKMYAFRSQGGYVNLMDNTHKRFGDAYEGNLMVLCALRRGMRKCLEIRAVIHNQPIQFVVDTGSHHNVISESYAELLGLAPVSAPAFEVGVANDKKMEIKSICEGVNWEMEGVEGIDFATNFYVLPMTSKLAVLGMDWLGTLGMTKCNFAIPSMEFRKGGKVISLRGSTVEVYPARNWLLLTGKILIFIVVFIVFFKLIL